MEYYWNSWRKLWDNNILINDVVVGDQWPNHLHGNGPMDSVQVGRAVFVKESYTSALPWESNPEPSLTYTDNFREPGANLRCFMMLIVRLLAIPTQDLHSKVFILTCAVE